MTNISEMNVINAIDQSKVAQTYPFFHFHCTCVLFVKFSEAGERDDVPDEDISEQAGAFPEDENFDGAFTYGRAECDMTPQQHLSDIFFSAAFTSSQTNVW